MHTLNASEIDVYDIQDAASAVSLGYEADKRGLVVQHDGEWEANADDLDDAARIISGRVGEVITLTRDSDGYTAAERWTVA